MCFVFLLSVFNAFFFFLVIFSTWFCLFFFPPVVHIWLISFCLNLTSQNQGEVVSSKAVRKLMFKAGRRSLRNDEGQDGKVTTWADGSLCVFVCVFLINTTMKVGCVEASGGGGGKMPPIHTTSTIQCLMYFDKKKSQWVSWAVITKTKKSIKCAYLAKGFASELYICSYASVSQRALFVIFKSLKGCEFLVPAFSCNSQPASQFRWFLTHYCSVFF